jgi:hypothetical protein
VKVTLRTTMGVTIVVWRVDLMFHARRAGEAVEPQVCLAVDLFEVIAELAGLDLELGGQAAEAISLADEAQRRLQSPSSDDKGIGDNSSAEAEHRSS